VINIKECKKLLEEKGEVSYTDDEVAQILDFVSLLVEVALKQKEDEESGLNGKSKFR